MTQIGSQRVVVGWQAAGDEEGGKENTEEKEKGTRLQEVHNIVQRDQTLQNELIGERQERE